MLVTKVEADGTGQANILWRSKDWGVRRKTVSENGDERGCYQEGCLKKRLQHSWLIVLCLLGERGLGHRCRQDQKGQCFAESSTSHHWKAAPGLLQG